MDMVRDAQGDPKRVCNKNRRLKPIIPDFGVKLPENA
jgi:hypothetical protein